LICIRGDLKLIHVFYQHQNVHHRIQELKNIGI
jgi:hypothetical protein